ncbi:MlaD family protein [Nocardia sp. NPDC051756]|uniref:MlaD family protein n=1 Tax=Nocardia sp. NPDC051756 TaxID=3154751 RepID=UPI0034245A51
MGIAKYQELSGRGPGPVTLFVGGIVGGAVLAVIALVFSTYAKGGFTPQFLVNVEAAQVGEGIAPGADVKMDGLRIGRVSRIESRGASKQYLQLSVEPGSAPYLADNVRARFVSSNTLGMTALELYYLGQRGTLLRDGATITLPADSPTITVTSVIRAVGEQFGKIDTGPAGRIGAVLAFEGSADGIAKMFSTAIELGRMKVGDQMLVGIDPRPMLREGEAGSAGVLRFSQDLLVGFRAQAARLDFLVNRHDDLEAIATFVAKVIGDVINIFPQPGFTQVIDALLSALTPVAGGVHGLTGFYHRIPLLLDQIDKAFVVNPDGTVSLQVQLLLANLPYLAGDPKVAAAGPQPAPGLPAIPGLPLPPGLFGNIPQGGGR